MRLNIEGLSKSEAMEEITIKLNLTCILPVVQALCDNQDGTQVYPVDMELMTKNYSKKTLQNLWRGMIMNEVSNIQYLHSLRLGVNWGSDEKSRLRAERVVESIQYIY